MLTEKPAPSDASGALPRQRQVQCYFQGGFVPLREAKIGVMTHAFMYGTACFEGVRAYWNADQGQLYLLKGLEHYRRLRNSARVLFMDLPRPPEELVDLTVELLRRNEFREDTYIRPSVYKSSEAIGVRLHDLAHDFMIVCLPFGDYIDTTSGISTMTTSWRRNADTAIPARSKITGGYVNSAFAKTDAKLNGHDEAIVLTAEGHVSEGSAENLFMVRDGALVTPPASDDILEGITRAAIIQLARRSWGWRRSCGPSTAASCTSPRRSSCAAPAPRYRRSRRSTTGPSGRDASARLRGASRTSTSTPCAAGCRPTPTG